MAALERLVKGVERLATWVGSILMISIMVIVGIDVVMRYVFRAPLNWSYDFISLYAMAGLFFLALAPAYRERAHIGVDVLIEHLSDRARVSVDLLGDVIGFGLFALIFWVGLQRTWVSYSQGEVLAGLIAWPTWLSNGVVPLGTALLLLRMILSAAANIGRLRDGSPPAKAAAPGSAG